MSNKWMGFGVVVLASFCGFTVLFHSIAFAQAPGLKAEALADDLELTALGTSPTPTIYVAPTSAAPILTGAWARLSEKKSEDSLIDILEHETLPTPTTKIQLSPTSIQAPSATPTSITQHTPTSTPTQYTAEQKSSGGMDAEKLFGMANAHRASIGLAALVKDEKTCSLAASRAPEIAGEIANGTLHSGMYGRNLPYWNTENAIAMGPEEVAFAWWLSDGIHRRAIENPSYTVSCVACTGVYCVQEFTSYQAK